MPVPAAIVTPASQPEHSVSLPCDAERIKEAAEASFASGDADGWTEDTLVQMVTRDLEDLCDANEAAAASPEVAAAPPAAVAEQLKSFYSAFKQPFGLDFYVRRLVQYTNCSASVFIVAMVYLDRLQQRVPSLRLSMMNVHRLLITAVVLAVKNLDDELYANSYYARVGGLTTDELNRLESSMLNLLDWRLNVTPETFAVFEDSLMSALNGDSDDEDFFAV